MKDFIQEELDKTIGKRISKLRGDNIKQVELANFLNIDRSTMSKVEAGTRSLSISQLMNLCEKFNVSIFYLLGETDCTQSNSEYIDKAKSQEDKNYELLLRLTEELAKGINQNMLSNYTHDKQNSFATHIYNALKQKN